MKNPTFEEWCILNGRIDLIKEWDTNNVISPKKVSSGSAKIVNWNCAKCGRAFPLPIRERTKRGFGCPYCSGKRITSGVNDLATLFPDLMKEWDYANNTESPETIGKGSHYNASWICPKGHYYKQLVYNRTSGSGCPYCSGRKMIPGGNDLQSCFPSIAAEWDYNKNGELTPEQISYGNAKKVFWICPSGHSYEKSINARTNKGYGCPYCSNVLLLTGFNDVTTVHPEYLYEWDYEKNVIKPEDLLFNSGTKVWWQCPNGHSYQCSPSDKNRYHVACPECMRELQTSFPEQTVFYYIKKAFPDAINGDKEVLNGRELDIYIPSKKTAIEYDGMFWHNQKTSQRRDESKSRLCDQHGIRLIRIREGKGESDNVQTESDIYTYKSRHYDDLGIIIETVIKSIDSSWKEVVNLERDSIGIQNQYLFLVKENSLEEKYPKIAKEWCYDKNGHLTPAMIMPGSGSKLWWRCAICGNVWLAVVSSRTAGGVGCPKCAEYQRRKSHRNTAVERNPMPEYLRCEYAENNSIPFDDLSAGDSKIKVLWICPKGHPSYKAAPYNRVIKKSGCPRCAGRNAITGINDLKTLYPEIADDWDYEKNTLRPERILPKSNRLIYWKCKKYGHPFSATPSNRVEHHSGCPYCSGQKLLKGFNDLASQFPELLSDWDYTKNSINPSDLGKKSTTKVHWKCNKCGQETFLSVEKYVKRKFMCRSCKRINPYI